MVLTGQMKAGLFILLLVVLSALLYFSSFKSSFQDLSDIQTVPGTLNVNSKYAVEALASK